MENENHSSAPRDDKHPSEERQHAGPTLRDALAAPSGEVLARLSGKPGARDADNFYPAADAAAHPSTDVAIDEFLSTYGHRSAEEDELLERLIFNPVGDYSEQLAREAGAPVPPAPGDDTRQARIDRFLLANPAESTVTPPPVPARATPAPTAPTTAARPVHPAKPAPTPPTAVKDSSLTESLAKIYIKTRRYERAYEILNDLSLRFPEKSAYFADQLRFLQKLIVNERHRRARNPQ